MKARDSWPLPVVELMCSSREAAGVKFHIAQAAQAVLPSARQSQSLIQKLASWTQLYIIDDVLLEMYIYSQLFFFKFCVLFKYIFLYLFSP
jgi:hypothetical protein